MKKLNFFSIPKLERKWIGNRLLVRIWCRESSTGKRIGTWVIVHDHPRNRMVHSKAIIGLLEDFAFTLRKLPS